MQITVHHWARKKCQLLPGQRRVYVKTDQPQWYQTRTYSYALEPAVAAWLRAWPERARKRDESCHPQRLLQSQRRSD